MEITDTVSVIPFLYLGIIYSVLLALFSYFFLCKTKIFTQIFRRNHRIFVKNIDCRVLAVFFNRKDSCHIGQIHIFCTFKKSPKKIQIFFLFFFPVFGHSEYTVPFINDENKAFPGFNKYLFKQRFQSAVCRKIPKNCKFFVQIVNNPLFDFINKCIKILFFFQKALDIKSDNIMPIQM